MVHIPSKLLVTDMTGINRRFHTPSAGEDVSICNMQIIDKPVGMLNRLSSRV